MLRAPADLNALEQLESLLSNQTPESKTLDYKRDLNLDTKRGSSAGSAAGFCAVKSPFFPRESGSAPVVLRAIRILGPALTVSWHHDTQLLPTLASTVDALS